MNYKPSKTTCHCGNPRRPKAQNCSECHRQVQREYRRRLREEQHGSTVYADRIRAFKRQLLLKAIRREGNMCRASIALGVCRSTMTRALRDVGLSMADVKRYLSERR